MLVGFLGLTKLDDTNPLAAACLTGSELATPEGIHLLIAAVLLWENTGELDDDMRPESENGFIW
jgi:hypothetical protein